MLQAECAATEILAETVNFPSSSKLRCYKNFLFPATAHLAAKIYRLFCQSIQVSHYFEAVYAVMCQHRSIELRCIQMEKLLF